MFIRPFSLIDLGCILDGNVRTPEFILGWINALGFKSEEYTQEQRDDIEYEEWIWEDIQDGINWINDNHTDGYVMLEIDEDGSIICVECGDDDE